MAGESLSLRHAQLTLARGYGYDSWHALRQQVETLAGGRTSDEIREERIRQQTSSAYQIARIMEEACASRPARTERLTTDFSNEIWLVETTEERLGT